MVWQILGSGGTIDDFVRVRVRSLSPERCSVKNPSRTLFTGVEAVVMREGGRCPYGAGRFESCIVPKRKHPFFGQNEGIRCLCSTESITFGNAASQFLPMGVSKRPSFVFRLVNRAPPMRLPFRLLLGCLFAFVLVGAITPSWLTPQTDDDERPEITVRPGFVVDHLYSPSEAELGSWVALTVDDQGNLLASDQYGALYRITVSSDVPATITVDSLDLQIGRANGLLWAYNSLYVMVNFQDEEQPNQPQSGLYRVTDSDGDGELDRIRQLQTFEGSGEHGPHGLALGPDGLIYMIAGNHTDLPPSFTSRQPPLWGDDNILPLLVDPRGHAVDRGAPGGWIARTDRHGTFFELYSNGFRNAYDIAFNADGELFTFDSDMEWDMGMPWYRPIRVLHTTKGSEFGWRTGSGKWPAYYPDNLPAVVNVGQGSPTGVLSGNGLAFPTRYQSGLFIFDWSFGTMYTVDLTPQGSSYRGEIAEFLSGVPLPLTDGAVGKDGALYFITGGRNLNSHLYRVRYVGAESTLPPAAQTVVNAEHVLRHELEALYATHAPEALEKAWTNLNHPDRRIRYTARLTLENQHLEDWQAHALDEPEPVTRTHALMALIRHADRNLRDRIFDALLDIDLALLDTPQKLDVLRAHGLAIVRLGMPSADRQERLRTTLTTLYPHPSTAITREAGQLLAALQEPSFVETTLALLTSDASGEDTHTPMISEAMTERSEQYGPQIAEMMRNRPPTAHIAHAYHLSTITSGWTPKHRETYFQWLFEALKKSGGSSYAGFISQIRTRALANVPEREREALLPYTSAYNPTQELLVNLPQPIGPGGNWNPSDIFDALWEKNLQPNYESGKRMYDAALCAACHTMQGVGGNLGPDLTQIGTRFNTWDLVQAIVLPSEVISDQYEAVQLTMTDGRTYVGRIVSETDDVLLLNQNVYDPNQTTSVPKADITTREASPLSLMPVGLLNRLSQQEVVDLIGYLESAGDPNAEVYSESP